ncbi:MAG: SRPBCC family protein [Pyrinomonadaceae bacterium]|nr:SRPBCC family protein [Pyrinomonadaceae bacterium]
MAIDVTAEVLIDRSPAEVAELMFDPKQDKLWVSGLSGVYPMESGQYKKGAKVERVGTFLNTHYNCKLLVTGFEENKSVQMYGDEPFEMNITYNLSETENGTEVKLRVTSISEIRFDTPLGVLSKKVLEKSEGDLKRLKMHLEME